MSNKPFQVIRKCPVCAKTEDLKTCSSCFLIGFCGRQHQVEFWPFHKDLCKLVSGLVKADENAKTIFDVAEFRAAGEGREKLEKTICNLLVNLSSFMGRELEFSEKMLIMHPRFCQTCGNTNFNDLLDCTGCRNVSFCKTGNCKDDGMEKHKKLCSQYWLQLVVNFDSHLPELFTTVTDVPKLDPNNFPKDIYKLVEALTGTKYSRNPKTDEELEELVHVSTFSFTTTILYVLHLCKLLNPDREKLIVHVVGAKHEYGYFNRESSFPLFAFLPKLKILEFLLIGNELLTAVPERYDLPKGRVVKIKHFQDFYENVRHIAHPDVVVCFNSGFSETPYCLENTWIAGLGQVLSHKNAPIAFTSYSQSERTCDIEFFERAARQHKKQVKKIFSGQNPFKDHRPIKNFVLTEGEDELFYGNNYLNVYETHK